jgi:hypothetical protein
VELIQGKERSSSEEGIKLVKGVMEERCAAFCQGKAGKTAHHHL